MDPLPLTLPEPHILTDPNTLITFTKENTHSHKNTLHREAGIWPLHPDARRWGQDAAPLTPGPVFCFFPNCPEPQFSCWGVTVRITLPNSERARETQAGFTLNRKAF